MATYILKPGKDARWLTLDVCKEFSKGECPHTDAECKFAHPPSHIDVHNGKVVCCFDYIKSKCQRLTPPCKYLHPPTHLKEQLLEMGRQNLIVKNLQLQSALSSGLLQPVIAVSAPTNSLPFMSSAKPVISPAYQTMILQNQQYATTGSPYIIPSTNPNVPYQQQQQQAHYQYINPSAYPSNGVVQLVGSSSQYASTNVIPINMINASNNYQLQVIPYMDALVPQADATMKLRQQVQQQQQAHHQQTIQHTQQLLLQTTMVTDDKMSVASQSRKRSHDALDPPHMMTAAPGASYIPSMKRAALIDAKSGLPMYTTQLPSQQLSFTHLPLNSQHQYLPLPLPTHAATYIQRL